MAARVNRAAMRPFASKQVVTYKPRGFAGFELAQSVFGRAEVIVSDGDVDVQTIRPTLGVHLDDFPQPPRMGDTLTRAGREYRVTSIERDGERGAMLVLQDIGAA